MERKGNEMKGKKRKTKSHRKTKTMGNFTLISDIAGTSDIGASF